jgi:hypothetical protein
VLGRGELHAAAATVHGGAGALVVARASKRAARTSGARARKINGKDRARVDSVSEGSERGGESRTRAPSRLSRMWTALLARLGEISIVLHAG